MSEGELLTIGQVASLSRVPATTLRYYEKCGLIEPPLRVSGQRRFHPSVISRLMVIRFCRVAGLSLEEIGVVLADTTPDRRQTKALARAQIGVIDTQIAQLELARRMMLAVSACVCPTPEMCGCHAMDDVVAEVREFLVAEHAEASIT